MHHNRLTMASYYRELIANPLFFTRQDRDVICAFFTQNEIVCTGMTTQKKTAAIRSILANHDDNLASVKAAKVSVGLEAIVIEAMNTALKDDLTLIFALKPKASASD